MNTKGWNTAKALEVSGAYWQACTLQVAVKLGVFEAIGNKHLGSREVASKLYADKRGMEMLLNALSAMGLLVKRKDEFSDSLFSKTYLCRESPRYIGHIIIHHHNLIDSWARMELAVKKGKPVRKRVFYSSSKKERESFLMGMFNLGVGIAPRMAEAVKLSGRRRLLDLGGGPGTYSVYFCLRNPSLSAFVFDLPTTKPFFKKVINKFHLSKRIKFIGGDYLKRRFKGKYDVAFLSHILHAESPINCQKLIKKVVSVLEPGGLLIIHDFILNNTLDKPLFPALFSLNMLLGTRSGQAYSQNQIMDMLSKAKVKKIKRLSFKGLNDSGVITGLVE